MHINFSKIKPGLYYAKTMMQVDSKMIEFLDSEMIQDNLNMGRICLHHSHSSALMAMLIIIKNKFIYPIHKHSWKDEFYTILEGTCEYKEYSNDGKLKVKISLESGQSILNSHRSYHGLIPKTSRLVFIENTVGPYTGQRMEFLAGDE